MIFGFSANFDDKETPRKAKRIYNYQIQHIELSIPGAATVINFNLFFYNEIKWTTISIFA